MARANGDPNQHYEADVAAGLLDPQIEVLLDALETLAVPVYLRIGVALTAGIAVVLSACGLMAQSLILFLPGTWPQLVVQILTLPHPWRQPCQRRRQDR